MIDKNEPILSRAILMVSTLQCRVTSNSKLNHRQELINLELQEMIELESQALITNHNLNLGAYQRTLTESD